MTSAALVQIDTALPLCPEDEKLQMRRWVITSVLESERTYLGMLDILMQVRHLARIDTFISVYNKTVRTKGPVVFC